MKNEFAKKMRNLREDHFPGQSLRSVALLLEKKTSRNFFTYLSKIENGTLPSPELLDQIAKGYKLTAEEYQSLWEVYVTERLKDEIAPATKRHGITLTEQPVLYRKVKKNPPKNKKNES